MSTARGMDPGAGGDGRSHRHKRLKRPPRDIFREHVTCPNYLRFRLGPDTAIALGVRVLRPGAKSGEVLGRDNELIATQDPALGALGMPPYERLLDEAMRGDQMLFARQDEIEAQWRVVDPILGDVVPVRLYDPGSWGPSEADQIAPCGCHNGMVERKAS